MAKTRQPSPEPPPPELVASRGEASAKIQQRIQLGKELRQRAIPPLRYTGDDRGGDDRRSIDLTQVRNDFRRWSDFNEELLARLFTTKALADDYSAWSGGQALAYPPSFDEEAENLYQAVDDKIHRLESIHDRLELIPERLVALSTAPSTNAQPRKKVFLVHGHDEAARESTARFIEKLGLEVVILHEQASSGMTIVEKLERYSDVSFAVVLLTPDDVGAARASSDKLRSRARQNVLLELGFFVGKLGRSHVCAIHKGQLELPSDYLGVGYVLMDESSAWKFTLAKELRAAGFAVDMNKAI